MTDSTRIPPGNHRLLVSLFLTAALAACGGGDDDSTAAAAIDETSSQNAGAATPTPAPSTSGTDTSSGTSGSSSSSPGSTPSDNGSSSSAPGPGTSAPAPAAPVPAPAPPPSAGLTSGGGLMPAFDSARIPQRAGGHSGERIRSTSERPRGSDGTGAFRTVCDYSHMASDDPLLYPRQPGRSHLHVFFGNTGASASSTPDSIAGTGNSTCRGGTLNRSAYWVPAMIDTRDGTPLRPAESHFYYKTGYLGVAPGSVQPIPPKLRMIAGDMFNTSPSGPFSYTCHTPSSTSRNSFSIPNCPVGGEIQQHVVFPQCWDGANLDSPDHKSHMAYAAAGRGCPASHPVPLPEITFNIVYPVTEANAPLRWRLSSDNYSTSQPGGYSAHADWMNGWRDDIMKAFVQNCDNPAVDCGSHLIGDGRAIY